MAQAQIGVGLRPTHYSTLSKNPSRQVSWFEAISENFMDTRGRPLQQLLEFRQTYPIALHGVSLSIGGSEPPNRAYLQKLKDLIQRVEPFIVSDHMCWTGNAHGNIHDLLPLPFTREALKYLIDKVGFVQDFLGRQILLENVSSYLVFKESEMTEWEFLVSLARSSGCKILLDVNNVYVSSKNHGFEAKTFLDAVPSELIGQVHLAGFTDRGDFLFDTHSRPVFDGVWSLFSHLVERLPEVPVLIEWDEDIPEFPVLEQEALKAASIWKEHHG